MGDIDDTRFSHISLVIGNATSTGMERSWWVQAGGGSADDLPVAAHPHAVPHLVPQRVPGCRPVTRRSQGKMGHLAQSDHPGDTHTLHHRRSSSAPFGTVIISPKHKKTVKELLQIPVMGPAPAHAWDGVLVFGFCCCVWEATKPHRHCKFQQQPFRITMCCSSKSQLRSIIIRPSLAMSL